MKPSVIIKKFGIEKAFDYLYKDPDQNLIKILNWAEKVTGDTYPTQIAQIRDAIENENNPYHHYIQHILDNVDPEVAKTIAINFFINENVIGWPKQNELKEKYNCNIPWAILLDPTSACNLHCIGCWAAEYGNKLNLSFEELDSIITQGKEMGVYFYLYTGGEPLVRKNDIIRLCEKHDDCIFMSFTNGTLIDEHFADEMLRVKNFAPAISLEGMESATDFRRGDGVFAKVKHAMELLHERKLIYGISSCYTSANYDSITSEEYYDMLIENGAYFIWYFHYMPVGNDASPELLPTPEQRGSLCTAGSGNTAGRNPSLRWISRMTLNIPAAALPEVGDICISMPTETWSPVLSSIIPIQTSGKRRCWKPSAPRCSRRITMASPLTKICSSPVPCWKIRMPCVRWSKNPERIPRICSLLKAPIICARNVTSTPPAGRKRRMNCGRKFQKSAGSMCWKGIQNDAVFHL